MAELREGPQLRPRRPQRREGLRKVPAAEFHHWAQELRQVSNLVAMAPNLPGACKKDSELDSKHLFLLASLLLLVRHLLLLAWHLFLL